MIKIFTYNVFWKSVSGEYKYLCFDNIISNINKNISKYNPDIICLQEASNHKEILNKLHITHYKPIIHTTGKETLLTLYKKDLEERLNDKIKVINIEFIFGRPITVLEFIKNNLYIINIHAPHFRQLEILNNRLSKLNITKSSEFIIIGDFNMNLNKNTKILNSQIYNYHNYNTYLSTNNKILSYDNIITNIKPKQNNHKIKIAEYSKYKPASDHIPVYGIINITNKIGYDFDGVIHRHVGMPQYNNGLSSRHPLIYDINNYTEDILFDKIIDNIKSKFNDKNIDNIYIITKRSDKCKNKIYNYLSKYAGIRLNKNNIICTEGKSKVDYLEKLKINEFYDDSDDNIYEIINNKHKLYVRKLYLTIPEKHKIKRIF
jgi:endonuclease/exonuclease/phosphatase family metal-dependent hydrolase